jgi:TetR/AcrR family transcriptional regulator, fatty acid biosynthesis regulator
MAKDAKLTSTKAPTARGRKGRAAKPAAGPAARRERAARMSPEARRTLILDAAAKIVVAHGVSGCTPEAVGAASNVSRPLIYKYFPTRDALLGAVLQREFDHIRGRSMNIVSPDAPAEEIRYAYTRRYMEYVMERGGLMRALLNDAGAISQVEEVRHIQQSSITQYWVDMTMKIYGVPKQLARMGTIMTIRAMEGAEGSLRLGKVDLDTAADFWTTFILAGWEATGAKFSAGKLGKRG